MLKAGVVVYYKKRERFEKYMTARAAGDFDNLLTAEQAVEAYYEFVKLWGKFTSNQKTRIKQLRQLEQTARAGGNPQPLSISEVISARQDDERFWEEAFESAERRTQDESGTR
jgi:hypothetical protein